MQAKAMALARRGRCGSVGLGSGAEDGGRRSSVGVSCRRRWGQEEVGWLRGDSIRVIRLITTTAFAAVVYDRWGPHYIMSVFSLSINFATLTVNCNFAKTYLFRMTIIFVMTILLATDILH